MQLPDISRSAKVAAIIRLALREDIGPGDATSLALVGASAPARARILARGGCVLAGVRVAARVFAVVDRRLRVRVLKEDGARVRSGESVLEIRGPARGILAAERVALNLLQRMTGIATLTRRFSERTARHGVDLLDTRKTTPGLRVLEKYAVRCGGGTNHRMGLYDRILIKDNHRAFWRKGGKRDLAAAVQAARRKYPRLPIEIEVETERDLKNVLPANPDWVLLDNMPLPLIRRCARLCRGRCGVEASGGITLDTIAAVAAAGVDAVSVGALTHSAPAADFSLEFDDESA
jgi:nicotinate-nucleotide pyrophosphorylase (carboxylating)